MVVSTPDEFDSVTDGSVDGEGDVTKNTLSRSNVDDVSHSGLGGGVIGRRVLGGRVPLGVLGLTLLNAVVVGVAPPAVASRTIGGGRLGWISRG